MEAIVIYGGSFDPIHNGHLRIARAASMLLNADVVFVPAKGPRWKEPDTTPEQRLAMLKAALKKEGSPSFSIDTFEMRDKAEVNYTIDTIRHFALKYKRRKLYLLIGADQVNAFPKWKDPDLICRLATPLYVSRPGVEIDDSVLDRYSMMRLDYDKSGDVSSSKVRSLQSLDIPSCVKDYIVTNKLYFMKKIEGMISPHRLAHSVSVAELAYFIAKKAKLENADAAYIAGLLHDIAKGMSKEQQAEAMKKLFPEFESFPPWTYHQFLGAHIAETEFGIEDRAVLDAILYHATGRARMTPLGKVVYASDKIEPLRGYDSNDMISECLKDYYLGFLYVLRENKKYLESKGYQADNPLTRACYDQYLR